jgi:hypothetical protein
MNGLRESAYICGHINNKCLNKHLCETCVEYGRAGIPESTNVFTSFKAYRTKTGTTFGALQNPHDDFYNYITELEAAFVNHFDEALNSAQVGQF